MTDPVPTHVAAAVEAAPPTGRKYKRGRFIPVARHDLKELLGRHVEPDAAAHRQYREICRLLEELIHREYRVRLARLKENYAAFDPDADVHNLSQSPAEELQRRADEVFDDARHLLEKANFRALPRDEVDAAVSAVSPWGLRLQVDLEVFEHLEVWARGAMIDHRSRRSWRSWFRLQHLKIPLYQRVMLAFQPQANELSEAGYAKNRIYLKLFKNIPEGDADMVLPGTRVRMTMLDRGKIVFPLLSGLVVTFWKILKGALIVAAVGFYGLLAYFLLIFGTISYGWRSFFGYKRTKEKYQLNLTQNLYYQKLDGDWGALLRLGDEAEDQEFRESLTAWFLLWRNAPHDGWMMEDLDRSAERLLQAELKRDVDFEVADAVDKLIRWGMIDVQHDGRLTPRSPEQVIDSLEERLRAAT